MGNLTRCPRLSFGQTSTAPVASSATRAPARSRVDIRALVEQHGYVVLYDGVCGLCNGFVQWVLKRDDGGTLKFATLQGDVGEAARASIPELANVDSIVVLHKGGAWIRSTAALEVARYIGGGWSLAAAAYIVPRFIRDAVYDFVARNRYGWFGKYDACPLPTPEQRGRFLG